MKKEVVRVAAPAALPVPSVEVAELLASYRDAAAVIEAQHPVYLSLPPVLTRFAHDSLFLANRPYGRLVYREEMYIEVPEQEEVVYVPVRYDRAGVFETVYRHTLLPHDRRLALAMPLSARLGFVVGWLSALSVAQPDEAQEGMVILAALVAPLLSTPGDAPQLSGVQRVTLRLAAARVKKGGRS